jgi:tetratricopeptide (TPR) repeat protein
MAWLEGPLEEQAIEVLQHLAKEKVLLLFDNATDEEQVQRFLPPAGQAHVLLSSTSRDWGPPLVEVWRPEGLQRLDPPTALAVFESVAGKAVAEQVGERVIAELGGLPVHLLPTARTLARKSRHGRLSEGQLVQLSQEGIDSFSIAWHALDPAARLLLQAAGHWFNPNSLVEAELVAVLAESFQGERGVRDAVDACRDLYLLQGEGRLTMHQLLVQFVQAQPPQRLAGIGAVELAPAVAAALGKAAERLEEAPADGEALAALQCHQLGWDFWRQHPDGPSADGCHHIGEGLFVLGQFAEASHWFEAAAALIRREAELDHLALGDNLNEIGNCAYEQGQWPAAAGWYLQAVAEKRHVDLHGRVDHESLGSSLHQLGNCVYQQGEWPEAAGWYEQALAESSQGGLHGRVDHESLGSSLHGLGNCAFQQGEWSAAAGWFEQAVAEARQGDLHGRVDHASLGRSLHQLGHCAFRQGQWSAAAGWCEQAVAEKRQGDVFGRVDQSSVANSEKSLALCCKKMGLA